MSSQNNNNKLAIKFRCPAELEGMLPPPIPATLGLPVWLKAMPTQAFNAINMREEDTIKRCPPFVDAMTCGFLIPLICDLRFENGEITWDNDIPPGGSVSFPRSPIGFHDASQVPGTPLFEPDRFVIKFHNLWTIEAPEGYAVFFTHPVNRFDLPFTTLSGFVDCDRYRDSWIYFPAHWHDVNFNGVLPKGTPIAQCIPVKREDWSGRPRPSPRMKRRRSTPCTNRAESRAGPLPAAIQGVSQLGPAPRNFAAALGRKKKRPCDECGECEGGAAEHLRPAAHRTDAAPASPPSRSPISIRQIARLARERASSGRSPSA